jgi:hypothetical protein
VGIVADTEEAARIKAAAIDEVQVDCSLHQAETSMGIELAARDILTVVSPWGPPHLAHGNIEIEPDAPLRLDIALHLQNWFNDNRDDVESILKEWGDAIEEDGSNDAEHEAGLVMAELLTSMLVAAKSCNW